MTDATATTVDGPRFDDLAVGDVFDHAPAVTLTDGLAAAHHAIVGGRLRLAFDRELSRSVTGINVASPALVWDMAIGQSTLVTQRAIANLFYRGLRFVRFPAIGDTIATRTEIVGLRPVTPKPGRPPRGLVVMRIRTVDQDERPILDFHRCAMLPARKGASAQSGEVDPPHLDPAPGAIAGGVSGWDLSGYRNRTPGPHFSSIRPGVSFDIGDGDVVTSAPELARLTFNLAAVHHDRIAAAAAAADGRRLVYGGHTIGVAAAQATRAFPALVTVLAWHSCDHVGPVHEGDTLVSTVEVERCAPLPAGGGLAHLRSRVRKKQDDGAEADVLDWRFVGLFA